MKMIKFLTVAVIFAAGICAAWAAPQVIEIKPEQFTLLDGASLEKNAQGEAVAVKLVSSSNKRWARAEFTVEFDPEVTYYILSFRVKAENVISDMADKHGADVLLKPGKGGALRFSSRGTYKSDSGTFDWQKAEHRVNVKRYLDVAPVKVQLALTYAPGTVWFDQIKLTPVVAKK
ncbi:MAG: hypothetical protein E7052_06805 [Lentisphaerae bacterium]|nr:hypothetical protein [Lentisphaerota bacterium]